VRKPVILGASGVRVMPVEDIFLGYYETTLNNNDLVVEFEVTVRLGWRKVHCSPFRNVPFSKNE
jgi:CO/xanthine dehydrogenase FAD-binding subunit